MATLPSTFKGTYGTMYYVKDMKKSIAFFKDQIGLHPKFEDEGWTEFDLGGPSLCLHPVGDKKIAIGSTQLIILVGDIQKEVSRLKEKKVVFPNDIMDMGEHGICAEFVDPDGNPLSLYQPPTRH
ncbi:MAG: glyoxalase/bleomycin resistance/dioxygenase family protein [Candidatus Wallbacteria bacterium]|nr:glyoxalase/bleomycin resistance/dioxygenase family protein [Candidatus Wallbacteria bacterium]